jgi:hypothetical protein
MNDEVPKKRRKRSPFTTSVNTVLVKITATMLPHDSPEFQERARRTRSERKPPAPPDDHTPDQPPPAAT